MKGSFKNEICKINYSILCRSMQQSVQEEIMKKFREIVREASQAVYGNKPQGGS